MNMHDPPPGLQDVRREPYTGIRNTLLEAIARSRLTGRGCRVFLAVLRLTLGWRKSSANIPLRKLHELTGISVSHISEALSELARAGFVRREKRMVEVIFPSAGNFPSKGTFLPVNGKKTFLSEGTATPISVEAAAQRMKTKERNKEKSQTNSDGGEQFVGAIAEMIVRAQGAPFTSREHRRTYVERHRLHLLYLSRFDPESIAKTIIVRESNARKVGYSWNPKHLADAIDDVRGQPIRKETAKRRLTEILSFLPSML